MAKQRIELYLSGGLSNTDKNLSLGGVKSSTKLFGNAVTYDVAGLAGVTLNDFRAPDNVTTGTLDFNFTNTTLGFTKDGGNAPTGSALVDISTDGDYILPCVEGDAILVVTVVVASLPGSDSSDTLTAVKINPNLFADVLEEDSLSGIDKYRHLYATSIDGVATVNLFVYIKENYPSLNVLAIGYENTVSGSEDQLLLNEDTAPTGVVFGSPTDTLSAESVAITPLTSLGIFLKLSVPPLSVNSNVIETASLMLESF